MKYATRLLLLLMYYEVRADKFYAFIAQDLDELKELLLNPQALLTQVEEKCESICNKLVAKL